MAILISSVTGLGGSHAQEPLKLAPDVQERCVKILRAGLQSTEFWPAMHAAEALTLAGHADEVVCALRDRLPAERDDQRRCGLARELIRAGQRDALTILLDILSETQSTGRVHAAESLFKLGEAGDKQQLRAAFKHSASPPLQMWAAAALARTGETDALQLLRKELQSPEPKTRITVAFALAHVGGPQDIEPLLKALDVEGDMLTRTFLANALAKLGDPKGQQEMLRNLDAADITVRTLSAENAGHARCVECQAKLIRLLDDPILDARIRAAQSLLALSGPVKNR